MNALRPVSFPITRGVWFVALFMSLIGMSTNMLYSYLAVSLKFNLNISMSTVASIDGAVEFVSYFLRIFSGAISDYLHNRKLLLVVGCSVVALVKPIFAIANSVCAVIAAEISERIGNGILASPRDALIADLSYRNNLGASFGFCKAIKTLGGVIGAAIAVAIMYISDNNYKLLFGVSTLPALLALICLTKVQNKKEITNNQRKFDNPFQKKYLRSLDKNFWGLIALAFACELGHFAESLLTIRSADFLSPCSCGITAIIATFGQVGFAYFIGMKSDQYNKLYIIRINLFLLLVSYATMWSASSSIVFLFGILIFYGQYAVIQALFLATITKNVSSQLRATATGIFYSVIGISYMASTEICGMFCDNFGTNSAFLYTSSIVFLAFVSACSKKETYFN